MLGCKGGSSGARGEGVGTVAAGCGDPGGLKAGGPYPWGGGGRVGGLGTGTYIYIYCRYIYIYIKSIWRKPESGSGNLMRKRQSIL